MPKRYHMTHLGACRKHPFCEQFDPLRGMASMIVDTLPEEDHILRHHEHYICLLLLLYIVVHAVATPERPQGGTTANKAEMYCHIYLTRLAHTTPRFLFLMCLFLGGKCFLFDICVSVCLSLHGRHINGAQLTYHAPPPKGMQEFHPGMVTSYDSY